MILFNFDSWSAKRFFCFIGALLFIIMLLFSFIIVSQSVSSKHVWRDPYRCKVGDLRSFHLSTGWGSHYTFNCEINNQIWLLRTTNDEVYRGEVLYMVPSSNNGYVSLCRNSQGIRKFMAIVEDLIDSHK